MKGCFIVSRDRENIKDIHFQLKSLEEGESIPEDQLKLRDEVNSTLIALRIMFLNEEDKFDEYFRSLLSLSQLGLVGDNPSTDLAFRALNSLKHEILAREGGKIKNDYMKKLGKYSLLFGTISFLLGILSNNYILQIPTLKSYLFLWSGCMLGVWLSFGTRKVILTFEDLSSLEKDLLSPYIRLLFTGSLTVVIGLLISTHVVNLELGGLSALDFLEDIKISLLIGVFCGLGEQTLSTKVSEHVNKFFDK